MAAIAAFALGVLGWLIGGAVVGLAFGTLGGAAVAWVARRGFDRQRLTARLPRPLRAPAARLLGGAPAPR